MSMKASYLLAGLFVLASILTDLVVAVQPDGPTLFFEILWLGLAFGQLALLALWCLEGHGPWLVRWLAALAGTGGIALVWSSPAGHPADQWLAALCLFMAMVIVVAALLPGRIRGAVSWSDRAWAWTLSRPPLQWSLGGLLSLMTSIAVGLSLWRHVSFPWPYLANLVFCATAFAGVAIASFSVMSCVGESPGRTAVRLAIGPRIVALSATCLASGLLLGIADGSFSIWQFTQASFVEAIVICFGCVLLQADQPAFEANERQEQQTVVTSKPLRVYAESGSGLPSRT